MSVHAERRLAERLLLLITRAEDERRVSRALEALGVPMFYQFRGHGTAPSELLDLCGLQGTARLLTLSVLAQDRVPDVFRDLDESLCLRRRGGGVAITIPVTGMQEAMRKIMDGREGQVPSDAQKEVVKVARSEGSPQYSMIFVATNYGYSDEVIDAARRAGARGGTIVKGRHRGSEGVMSLLGMSVQEEQEFSLVIVPQEKRADVMVEVNRACGLKTPAHGVIVAVPVEDTMGLA